jgi:hypothetical protein
MGTILHIWPDWHVTTPVAFGTITVVYIMATTLIWRYLGTERQAR